MQESDEVTAPANTYIASIFAITENRLPIDAVNRNEQCNFFGSNRATFSEAMVQ